MKDLNDRGAAAIEFALVLPVLLVLVFGMIDFSLLLYDKAVITNASREGARAAIVFRPVGSEIACPGDIEAIVNDYAQNNLITFGPITGVETEVSPCPPVADTPLTVTVRYEYDFLALPNLVEEMTGKITLAGVTQMIKE